MKSSARTLTDYRTIPVRTQIPITPLSGDEIQKKLRALSRGRRQVLHPDVIQKGDVVTLTLESEDPRFNRKNLPVTVGSGLYDRELESALIGLAKGGTKELCVGGHPVRVCVLSVTRTVFPEPTSGEIRELAASLGQDFTTAEEYTAYLQRSHREDQQESAVYETMQAILDGVVETSDWDLDEAEEDALYRRSMRELDGQAREDLGKPLEDLTDEEIQAHMGVENRAELEESTRENARSLIASALFFAHLKGLDPRNLDPDDDELMDYAPLESYVRSIITYKEVQQ